MTRLILMSSACLLTTTGIAGELPLDDVPIRKVYEHSLNPSNCRFEFANKHEWIFAIGTHNRFYLYDIASKQMIEYGTHTKAELGKPLIAEPDTYSYQRTLSTREALLWSVRNDRLIMWRKANRQVQLHWKSLNSDKLTLISRRLPPTP